MDRKEEKKDFITQEELDEKCMTLEESKMLIAKMIERHFVEKVC